MDLDKLAKLEQAAAAAKDYRAIEAAIDLLKRAIAHDAEIWNIQAEDAAEAERSVPLEFTAQESAIIFAAAIEALQSRLTEAKAKVEAM